MKVLMVVVALAVVGLLGAWFALGIYMFSGLAEPLSGDTDISAWEKTDAVSTRLGKVIGLDHVTLEWAGDAGGKRN